MYDCNYTCTVYLEIKRYTKGSRSDRISKNTLKDKGVGNGKFWGEGR